MSKSTHFVGVDGCRAGWFAAWSDGAGVQCGIYDCIKALWKDHQQAARILIDMPIGLPTRAAEYPRACDAAARSRLGRRACTVFSVPLGQSLAAANYHAANALHRLLTTQGISKQAFNIGPKILEVNRFLLAQAPARKILAESHPELCFLSLHGEPIAAGKKSAQGLAQRLALLGACPGLDAARIYREACAAHCRATLARDDILDALALLHGARQSDLESLPADPPADAHSLPMRILMPRLRSS